jgi:integrase
MPLELRRQRDGSLRSTFYGSFEINGKRHRVNLAVPIKGTPPEKLRLEGDIAFERSRARAAEVLRQKVEEAKDPHSVERWANRLHEIQTGERPNKFPIENLAEAWDLIPSKKANLSERYIQSAHSMINDFVAWMAKHHSTVVDAGQVTREMARSYLTNNKMRRRTAKTRNDYFKRLRSTFEFLRVEYSVVRNPFEGIHMLSEEHVHHRPLNEAQADQLLEAVEGNSFVRPLVACGLSTGMRLGDCCKLQWSSIHIGARDSKGTLIPDHISVKTSKTGVTVDIPLFARLRRELDGARETTKGKGKYVWPEQAEAYIRNDNTATNYVRKAFRNAGFSEDELTQKRSQGVNRASLISFPSLRTTWITEALSRGVPIEKVRLISGHSATEVVLKHYYKPGLDSLSLELENLLPAMITGAEQVGDGKSRDEQMREILEQMDADSLEKDRVALLDLLQL